MTRKLPGRTGTVTIDEAADSPAWFKPALHRVEPRGIVLAATGDLLAEDGLPVNAAARAALAAPETEAPAEPPAAEQE
jgi:hypothetical protein